MLSHWSWGTNYRTILIPVRGYPANIVTVSYPLHLCMALATYMHMLETTIAYTSPTTLNVEDQKWWKLNSQFDTCGLGQDYQSATLCW